MQKIATFLFNCSKNFIFHSQHVIFARKKNHSDIGCMQEICKHLHMCNFFIHVSLKNILTFHRQNVIFAIKQ